jgi:hypothetical protein
MRFLSETMRFFIAYTAVDGISVVSTMRFNPGEFGGVHWVFLDLVVIKNEAEVVVGFAFLFTELISVRKFYHASAGCWGVKCCRVLISIQCTVIVTQKGQCIVSSKI